MLNRIGSIAKAFGTNKGSFSPFLSKAKGAFTKAMDISNVNKIMSKGKSLLTSSAGLKTDMKTAGHIQKMKQPNVAPSYSGAPRKLAPTAMHKQLGRYAPGTITLGAIGMFTVSMMQGMNNQAREIVHQRYMQDTRYAGGMLTNARVGLAASGSSMMARSNTSGLSNALHSNRHGRGGF